MSEQAKRISRQELYEKIWIAPLKKVAEELGSNCAELARVCDELNVPKPVPGHWQRLKLGRPIEVFSLPEPTPGMAVEGMLKPKGSPKNKTIPATDHEMENLRNLPAWVRLIRVDVNPKPSQKNAPRPVLQSLSRKCRLQSNIRGSSYIRRFGIHLASNSLQNWVCQMWH